jgi:hypothetical protein
MASIAINPLFTNFSASQKKSPSGLNNVPLGEQIKFSLMWRKPLTLSGMTG